MTRKLLQGGVRPESDPLGFFYGVARNILREHSADQVQHRSALLGHLPANSGSQVEPEEDVEKRLAFLERCLSRLPLPDRELIVAYYQGRRREKIGNRKALADRLGIPMNALWIRSHRLRLKLESCIDECMARSRAAKGIDEDSH